MQKYCLNAWRYSFPPPVWTVKPTLFCEEKEHSNHFSSLLDKSTSYVKRAHIKPKCLLCKNRQHEFVHLEQSPRLLWTWCLWVGLQKHGVITAATDGRVSAVQGKGVWPNLPSPDTQPQKQPRQSHSNGARQDGTVRPIFWRVLPTKRTTRPDFGKWPFEEKKIHCSTPIYSFCNVKLNENTEVFSAHLGGGLRERSYCREMCAKDKYKS